nr:pistil-specific extensin-like protein [Aegilops tauschii subsp. strangulata]
MFILLHPSSSTHSLSVSPPRPHVDPHRATAWIRPRRRRLRVDQPAPPLYPPAPASLDTSPARPALPPPTSVPAPTSVDPAPAATSSPTRPPPTPSRPHRPPPRPPRPRVGHPVAASSTPSPTRPPSPLPRARPALPRARPPPRRPSTACSAPPPEPALPHGSVVFHLGEVIGVGAVGPRSSVCYSNTSSTAEGELRIMSLDFILKSTGKFYRVLPEHRARADQIVLRQCKKKARQMQYEVRYVAISTYHHDHLGVKLTKEDARRMGITLERDEFLKEEKLKRSLSHMQAWEIAHTRKYPKPGEPKYYGKKTAHRKKAYSDGYLALHPDTPDPIAADLDERVVVGMGPKEHGREAVLDAVITLLLSPTHSSVGSTRP